jgi:hypothetical protein
MTDSDLVVLIKQHEDSSIGNPSNAAGVSLGTTNNSGFPQSDLTTVEIDRYNAANYYFARPLGNEQADRSQIVMPVLRDTVEWTVPQLMRMFSGTSRICQFDPEHPGDEQFAEQETDVVNYVFMKQNPGFHILQDAFKDALLFKCYYLKAYWDKSRKISIESYSGLSSDELAMLKVNAETNGDTLDFIEQDETTQQTSQGEQSVYALKVRRVTTKGRIKVECVPPEEMRVSVRTRNNMDDSPFIAHVTRPTRSDLIEMGYDEDVVMEIPAAKPAWVEMDQLARDSSTDEQGEETETDPSMIEVELKECYIRVDYDGDGIAELRRICVAGSKILDNEEVDEHPFSYGVPIRMSHRHLGLSLYDTNADLQMLQTMMMRAYMDNFYFQLNIRTAVDQNTVNMDDLLVNRPGGVVRTKGSPMQSILPLINQPVGEVALNGMELIDKLRTFRTGVGASTMGLDPDALQDVTAAATESAQSSATLMVEGMARNLSEGIKEMFRKIHGLLIRHQDKPMVAQVSGNFVPVDPSQWRSRTMVTVNVGLGSGNRQEMRSNAMLVGQVQQQLSGLGLAGPRQIHNTAVKFLESIGWENGNGQYVLDPDSPEYKQLMQQRQQAPNPRVQVAQAKAQADLQVAQLTHQEEMQRIQAQAQAQTSKDLFNARVNQAAAAQKAQLDAAQAQLKTASQLHADLTQTQVEAIVDLVKSALLAKAQPQQIESDTSAAEQAVSHL